MNQNSSNKEKKPKREIRHYAKINPNDPGPYTKKSVSDTPKEIEKGQTHKKEKSVSESEKK